MEKDTEETKVNSKMSMDDFRLMAEAMPQIVWATTPDGLNIYFNYKWVEYTGMTLGESRGSGWNTPFHPDDQKRALIAWENATKNKSVYSLESRLKKSDGSYRWFLIRGEPLINKDGEVVKWFGTCTDIESIKTKENELIKVNQLMTGRELKMIELKKEIAELQEKCGNK